GQRAGHEVIVLRRLEYPLTGAINRLDDIRGGRQADQGRAGFRCDIAHGDRGGRHRRAQYDIDVFVGRQLAPVLDCLSRIGGVIQHDVLHLFTPISSGSNATVLRSGLPSEAAGPVEEMLTPTLICAMPASGRAPSTAASAPTRKNLFKLISSS